MDIFLIKWEWGKAFFVIQMYTQLLTTFVCVDIQRYCIFSKVMYDSVNSCLLQKYFW